MDAVTQRLINTVSSAGGGGGGGGALYSDDVFSSCVYDGKSAPNQIVNNIDLQNNGGLVWVKERTTAQLHNLWDSARGISAGYLQTNDAGAQIALSGIASFNTDGFTLQGSGSVHNAGGLNYCAWTFRKAAKFFDIVTWTGNNAADRAIPHALNCSPGLILVKAANGTNGWFVWHRSLPSQTNDFLRLHQNGDIETFANIWGSTPPSSSDFHVYNNAMNSLNTQYVAYVFAHDAATDGIIKCGSFTTNAQGFVDVDLGWEPQFLMLKATSPSAAFKDWLMIDNTRDFTVLPAMRNTLKANSNVSEAGYSAGPYRPTPIGFKVVDDAANANSSCNHIYIAIRRPNKPPVTGADVFAPLVRLGNGALTKISGIGFKPDMLLFNRRTKPYGSFQNRLTGSKKILSTSLTSEYSTTNEVLSFDNTGVTVGSDADGWGVNANTASISNLFFKRAAGFFDIVAYRGTGFQNNEPHGLKVPPELIFFFTRNSSRNHLAASEFGNSYHSYGTLNTTSQIGEYWNYAAGNYFTAKPTADILPLGSSVLTNEASVDFLVLLFATLPGVSKIGTYTGNGSVNGQGQNIDCGFTTGARFVLVKRKDSGGEWIFFDTARGILTGADPSLSMSSTAGEVNGSNSIAPESSGFTIIQDSLANLNVLAAKYIFLAIA